MFNMNKQNTYLCVAIVLSVFIGSAVCNSEICEPALKHLGKHGLDSQYIRTQLPSNGTDVCKGGHCCIPGINDRLVGRGRHLIHAALQDGTYKLLASVERAILNFENAVLGTIQHSEDTTLLIYKNSYPRLYEQAKEPVQKLYEALRSVLTDDPDTNALERALTKFWDDLFPLIFHNTVHARLPPFAPSYVDCLRKSRTSIRPWKLMPTLMVDSLLRGMEATYFMMHTLRIGKQTIEEARKYKIPEECGAPAARLYFCSACHGSIVPPCSGLCLNVARGCLAPLAELDGSWIELGHTAARVEEAIRGSNVVEHLSVLPDRFSDAVLVVMQSGNRLQKMAQAKCGPYRHVGQAEFESTMYERKSMAPTTIYNHTVEQRAQEAVNAIKESRGFWANLADRTCEPLDTRDTECWNGLRVAQYSRPAPSHDATSQKYNPEVQVPRLNLVPFELAEQLRSVKKTITTRLKWMPESYSRQYTEGSGSGPLNELHRDDEGFDDDDMGSGSGFGPLFDAPGTPSEPTSPVYVNPPSSATDIQPIQYTLFITVTVYIMNW